MAVQQRTLAAPKLKTEGRRLHLMPLLTVAAALVIVLGLARVVQTSQATTAGFAMQSLQQEKLELETSVKQLEAEVATLSSLERIEREATRLGLQLPERVSYVAVAVAWPGTAADLLPARFAPVSEDAALAGVDGSPDDAGWWQHLLNSLPFY
ncbi:MAG: hypothetical protein IIC91_02240 [Chloroflexi bacterium]|nr:hypothetical protein [Chloroflexota bacterium]MCH8007662.1 hypothetical protein [Chloroflexota bacterium]MCH8161169.1 hypothetical protein [Chloroflexota bacterium]